MSNSPRLEMRGVRRSFGATKALRGVEFVRRARRSHGVEFKLD
jgi:ABC-type sugar transport system ATPase subunit